MLASAAAAPSRARHVARPSHVPLLQGAKIGKQQRGDKLEQLLARNDSSKALRTIHDPPDNGDLTDARRRLVSTEQSLGMDPEPRIPTAIEGLETFSLSDDDDDDDKGSDPIIDADSFFNLPSGDDDEQPR